MATCSSPAPRITLPLSGTPIMANAMVPSVATTVPFGAVTSQVRPTSKVLDFIKYLIDWMIVRGLVGVF